MSNITNATVIESLPDPSENNAPTIIALAGVSAVVTTSFVALRFYVRGRLIKVLGWEDWIILVALVCGVACSVTVGIREYIPKPTGLN